MKKTLKVALLIIGGILILVVLVLAGSLLKLKGDVGSYQNYWLARSKAPVAQDALIYIALGDSAAQGLGATKPERGYVGLVSDYLHKQTGRPVHVINLSKSGAKAGDLPDTQLRELKKLPKADIVTVEIGANDMVNFNKKQFEQDIAAVLSDLPDSTVVANLPSFADGRLRKHQPNILAGNTVVEGVIAERGYTKADIFSATSNLGYLDFAADYFHPSDRAYKKWAAAFIESIEQAKLL